MLFRNAVEFTQMTFGLTPEVLNPVNVVLPVCKTGAVIDAQVVKLANIQYIVGTMAISINHAVRPYLFPDNRQQGSRLRIGYGNGVNLTVYASTVRIPPLCRLLRDRVCLCGSRQNNFHLLLLRHQTFPGVRNDER